MKFEAVNLYHQLPYILNVHTIKSTQYHVNSLKLWICIINYRIY